MIIAKKRCNDNCQRIAGTKYHMKQQWNLKAKIPGTVATVHWNLLLHSASESQKSNNLLHQL